MAERSIGNRQGGEVAPTTDLSRLLRIREVLGPFYGSEDLCLLFYSLIKREQPRVIVELGTGLGVCTAWMGQALNENGRGHVYTIDDGRQFDRMAEHVRQRLDSLSGILEDRDLVSHAAFLTKLLKPQAQVITKRIGTMSIGSDVLLPPVATDFGGHPIDMIFSDFDHSPAAIMETLAFFLPRMAECASIFFDSASTSRISFPMLEGLVRQLNANKIPRHFLNALPKEHSELLREIVQTRQFRLMHLIERKPRIQNSTAWLRIEPIDWQPHPVTILH